MSYWQKLVPPDFEVPVRLEGDGFHLRMLTVNDLVKDYDAVMSSAERLKGSLSPTSTWPQGPHARGRPDRSRLAPARIQDAPLLLLHGDGAGRGGVPRLLLHLSE